MRGGLKRFGGRDALRAFSGRKTNSSDFESGCREVFGGKRRNLVPFGKRAGPFKAIARYVGKQALHEHENPIVQEMYP
jgi:hypothetical protein